MSVEGRREGNTVVLNKHKFDSLSGGEIWLFHVWYPSIDLIFAVNHHQFCLTVSPRAWLTDSLFNLLDTIIKGIAFHNDIIAISMIVLEYTNLPYFTIICIVIEF